MVMDTEQTEEKISRCKERIEFAGEKGNDFPSLKINK